MANKKELEQQITSIYAELQQHADFARQEHSSLLVQLQAELKHQTNSAQDEFNAARDYANSLMKAMTRQAKKTSEAAKRSLGISSVSWESRSWLNHALPRHSPPPTMLRLGELQLNSLHPTLPTTPAFIPIARQRHFLISFEAKRSTLGAQVLESLSWRIAALSSPGSYRFLLLDPLDHGTNLASLLNLPENIRGAKIYSQENELEQALLHYTSEMGDVIQRRLLNTYKDIEAYNKDNPKVSVPYHFIVLVGFPRGFTSKAADLLFSLARSGSRAGYFILGGVLRGEKSPHGFNFAEFMKQASYVRITEKGLMEWDVRGLRHIPVQPDAPPSHEVINSLVKAIRPLAATSTSSIIPFRELAVRKAHWWQAKTTDGMDMTIGLDESGKPYTLSIGRGLLQHGLVGGQNNSGKSNLLHLLILTLGATYSPEEIEFYLVDFKECVEFQGYVTHKFPHASAVVLEAEREFGLSVLKHLLSEMERRSEAFKAVGVNAITDFRQRTGKRLSRIVLIMDEYVVLFSEDDRLAFEASEALAALVMRGRSFGIHVLLSAQRPTSTFLSMSHIKSQMAVRIAFKCRPEDSTLILGEGNERASGLTEAGEACVTSDPDSVDATSRVRIAYLSADERDLYQRGLHEFARFHRYVRRTPTIVFSRNASASWLENREVAAMLKAAPPATLTASAWLGLPLRIAPDLRIDFSRHQGSNLLVLGMEQDIALRLLFCALLGLGLTASPKKAMFLHIGFPGSSQQYLDTVIRLGRELPHHFNTLGHQEALDGMTQLMTELDKRLTSTTVKEKESLFIVISGLHQWQDARGPNTYTPSLIGEMFAKLIQQGPAVGIHTLLWCDRMGTIGAVVGGGDIQNAMAQFSHRVALQMSADESVSFLGISTASKLGGERAYYRNEQWPADEIEKFKPYSWLSSVELKGALNKLRGYWLASRRVSEGSQ